MKFSPTKLIALLLLLLLNISSLPSTAGAKVRSKQKIEIVDGQPLVSTKLVTIPKLIVNDFSECVPNIKLDTPEYKQFMKEYYENNILTQESACSDHGCRLVVLFKNDKLPDMLVLYRTNEDEMCERIELNDYKPLLTPAMYESKIYIYPNLEKKLAVKFNHKTLKKTSNSKFLGYDANRQMGSVNLTFSYDKPVKTDEFMLDNMIFQVKYY